MLVKFDGARLRELRELRDMSQAELADRADTTIRYVRAMEKGRKDNPSANMLCRLAFALDAPMEAFMQIQPEEHDSFYYEREEEYALL